MGETISADDLVPLVRDFFARHADRFGLGRHALDVRWVLNWGGFVNHSFRISDGRREVHLKLAVAPDAQTALRRWHGLADELRAYRAPPVLGHVEIGGASGLVFPVVRGGRPVLSDELLASLLGCLQRLWADREIASALPDRDGRTASSCYFDGYHDRFTEDLRGIEAACPPFLSRGHLRFMREEVARLAEAVRSHPAFGRVLRSPIHGDLWADNIIWENADSWHIVDWDDLQVGDPAMDLAMLLGPTAADLAPLKHREAAEGVLSPDMAARFEILGRASLLDWVIDPVSDWIEAEGLPPDVEGVVRREKERIHAQALALYRSLYRGGSASPSSGRSR